MLNKTISAYKIVLPQQDDFPNNNDMLWKEWQLQLICKYLPERWTDGWCVVDYAGIYGSDCIESIISGIKSDLEEDADALLQQFEEKVSIDDVNKLLDWLQICLDKQYVIYIE